MPTPSDQQDKTPVGVITDIRIQRVPIKRAAIVVDGRLAGHACVQDAQGLSVGHSITGQVLSELNRRYQRKGAYLQAVRYLGRRDRSVLEVRRHLDARGWDSAAGQEAVERLQAEGYLDDRAFADKWVDLRCRTAPRSRRAVTQELRQKGIRRAIIDAAVAGMDEELLALACVQKKARQWQRYDDSEKERRIITFLQRKGFPYVPARKAAQTFIKMAADN